MPEQHAPDLRAELAELHARLDETQQALHAIRQGNVNAITVTSAAGEQVYSLHGAELPYREMIEAMSEGALNLSPDGLVLYCNQRLADMARADLRTIIGCRLQALFAEQDGLSITQALRDSRSGITRVRAQLRTSDGGMVPVNVTMHVQADGGIRSIVTIITDLTDVMASQEVLANSHKQLAQANRALHMLNVCDAAIIRATDEKRLLSDTCQTLVDVGGYKLAWVGYVEHDEAKSVRPVAQADGGGNYVDSVHVSWGSDELGGGPSGTAIRSGKITVVRDTSSDVTFRPWRERAQREGLNSAAAVPLRSGDEVFGVLVVYSGRQSAFDVKECELLTELADDIAYCVTNLRREEKLAETRAFLDNLLQSSTKYSIISEDPDRKILYWNEGARRNYGYTADEVIGKSIDMLNTPESHTSGEIDRLLETARTKGTAEIEIERVRKDGTRFPANVVVTRRDDALGQLIGYLIISIDITEKRQSEAELQARGHALEAETNKLRSILDSMGEAVVVADRDGNIIEANPAARSMQLVSASDTSVASWAGHSGLLLPDCVTTLPEEQNPLVRALMGENTDALEICLDRTDRPAAHVDATARPIRGADGTLSGGLVVLSDVTERKRTAAALQESADIFRTLTDAMPQLVWMCTPDGLAIYFNQQWVDYTGLTLEESYGQGWDTPFHPDDKSATWDAWIHATRTGATYRIESRLRAADGSFKWFLMKGEPLHDADGHITKWIGTCTDIDELKRAEAKLSAASQYSRSLLEASLDPLVTISPVGKITDVNHGTELITGERRERLIGTDFATYFTEPERARAGYRQVFTKGFVIDYSLAIRHVSGTVTEVLFNASLYRNPDGEVAGVFAAARDISRLPASNAITASSSRTPLWRYALYAIAAAGIFVSASAASLKLHDWLQGQQDNSELLRAVATNSRMRNLLSEVFPTPARVRLGLIQTRPGTNVMSGYTISYAVATPNHPVGVIGKELPLSLLSNQLAMLTSGNCVHGARATNDETLNLADEVICPITNAARHMQGILSVSWDHDDPVPANFDAAAASTKKAAADIAVIWADNVR